VLFSGDKLLGWPQVGIIAGRKDLVLQIEKDPLMRALRLDKMTLAALEATLRLYLNEPRALREVPVLHMLDLSLAELRARAEALATSLRSFEALSVVEVRQDEAYAGGGSLPEQALTSWVVELEAPALGDVELAHRLRTADPAVVTRLRGGRVVLDLRTVLPHQENALVEVIGHTLSA